MDRLAQIEAFVRVAEHGSFSAAARSLRATQPSVSKAVAELERSLRTRLLYRTTRTLSLTGAGTAYYERARRILALLGEADAEALGAQDAVTGRLRVNTPAMLAKGLVVPALMAFRKRFPGVTVEVAMDDRRIDPVAEAVDVAVRVGALSDSTLRVRRAGRAGLGLFAAPSYLASLGHEIATAADLSGLEFIRFEGRRGSAATPPIRDHAGQEHRPEWAIVTTVSNGVLAREFALASAGVVILPRFLVGEDIREGRLVELLPGANLPAMEISLLHSFSRDPPRRVTGFLDMAIELWRDRGLLEP